MRLQMLETGVLQNVVEELSSICGVEWTMEMVEVKVVTTEHAKHFYESKDVPAKIYSDLDEWEMWKQRTDPVLHIELRRWADLLVIAPLDANTLGKIANGICDNLLTCVVRAWDLKRPLLFCPAMNTAMWEHPITATQIQTLKGFGYIEVPCIVKKLLCGDEGYGAMAEISTIVEKVQEYLEQLYSNSLGEKQ
ncbi:phosphopantothenoylcysteine decarboxylase isoform X1 [Hemitrygon akajei]|uniref:phosphopantothenoylcysteine decarboxylase isoform X1 n=2 Tax=Hemitrygon akajei TaxID=2704970 RepID=UPI003BF9DAF3